MVQETAASSRRATVRKRVRSEAHVISTLDIREETF
jgi:hypothetical protein